MRAVSQSFRIILTVILGLASARGMTAETPGTDTSSEWISLFDGNSLEGWTPRIQGHAAGENPGAIFRIEDGTILATYREYEHFTDQFGHLFHDVPWSHYRLRLEYRFTGPQLEGGPNWAYLNSGVMIHSQTADSMKLDQSFPDSVEVQFLGSTEETKRPTGNICTPGTKVDIGGALLESHCVNSSSPPWPADEWVLVEVEVKGSEELIIQVNGMEVLRATNLRLDDGTPLSSGTICVQAESHDCAYRNIEILPMD